MTVLTVIDSPSGRVDVCVDDDGRMILRAKPLRLAFPTQGMVR